MAWNSRIYALILFALVVTAVVQAEDNSTGNSTSDSQLQTTISGWFHIIWSDRAHYVLLDEKGNWKELLRVEEHAKPYGGPLGLNKKRVRILGTLIDGPKQIVQVKSIQLE